jgi:hypothetical protein
MLQALAKASFAAPVGGPVVVSYPFVLTPGRPPASNTSQASNSDSTPSRPATPP